VEKGRNIFAMSANEEGPSRLAAWAFLEFSGSDDYAGWSTGAGAGAGAGGTGADPFAGLSFRARTGARSTRLALSQARSFSG